MVVFKHQFNSLNTSEWLIYVPGHIFCQTACQNVLKEEGFFSPNLVVLKIAKHATFLLDADTF